MSDFQKCFEILLRFEGTKYENVPGDKGGHTKYGITLKAWTECALNTGCGHDYDFLQGLKRMGGQEASRFYRLEYWNKFMYGNIDSTDVAARIFLASVHRGPYNAHLAVQRALRACKHPVEEDGILGPITLAAINQTHDSFFIVAFRAVMASEYRGIIAADPSQEQFRAGWIRRANY